MKKEFVEAIINEIEKISIEKDIPKNEVSNFLIDSIKKTYFKKYQVDNLDVFIDLENKNISTNKILTVVSNENANTYDDYCEILEDDPLLKDSGLKIGDFYKLPFDLQSFGRHDVQIVLQGFKQKIMESVNSKVYVAWKPYIDQIFYGDIEKYDQKTGGYYVEINDTNNHTKTIAFMPKKESNPLEHLKEGNRYPFVIKNVVEKSNFWPVVLSRANEKLVEHYMNEQIAEIEQGLIKIEAAARIAGYKTKLLVKTASASIVEPIAICIGAKGQKIKAVSSLVGGEKIDIYNDYKDPIKNIFNIFGKEVVKGILPTYNENNELTSAIVYMNANDIQMALGKGGSNAKLIAKLLGIYIQIDDIEYYDEDENFITPDMIEWNSNQEELDSNQIENSMTEDEIQELYDNIDYDPELLGIDEEEMQNLLDNNEKKN